MGSTNSYHIHHENFKVGRNSALQIGAFVEIGNQNNTWVCVIVTSEKNNPNVVITDSAKFICQDFKLV